MRILSFIAGLVLVALQSACSVGAPAAPDFSACPENFFHGQAPQASSRQPGQLRALCFDSFAVLYSGQSKTPVYSAEYLTRERLEAAEGLPRTNRFYEEARLPAAERATLEDYRHRDGEETVDRGHMSPAADMPNANAMAQSFSLANMVPQAPENNRGAWAKNVERPTRQYAKRSAQGVYVLTGPIYSQPRPRTKGPGEVWIPDQLFKLVYDPARKKAWAYVLPNTNDARVTGVISYGELVRLLGMELLPPGAL